MVTVIIDHTNELTKLTRRGWSSKAQDCIDLVRLRFDSIRRDDVAKIFNFFDGKMALLGLDREISTKEALKTVCNMIHMLDKFTLGKNSNVIEENFHNDGITK